MPATREGPGDGAAHRDRAVGRRADDPQLVDLDALAAEEDDGARAEVA